MQVEFGHCLTDEDKQEQIDKVARELQRFYDEHDHENEPERHTAECSEGDISHDSGELEQNMRRMSTAEENHSDASNEPGEQRKRRRRSCSPY